MERIALIPNSVKDEGLVNTRRIADFLHSRAKIFMEEEYASTGIDAFFSSAVYNDADCAVVLGGDGTILQIAPDCARRGIPVLGINLGTIGFMTEIETADTENALIKLLNDEYTIEKRMMMKATVVRDGENLMSFHALNDVVISKALSEKLISIELSTDGEEVNKYIADGLIIATPTGSTGYSISAGGPVVDPRMRLYIATPICAHMLSARSAVLAADRPIKIKSGGFSHVSGDGDVHCDLNPSDEVLITQSNYDFELIKIGKSSFYDTLISKLS